MSSLFFYFNLKKYVFLLKNTYIHTCDICGGKILEEKNKRVENNKFN